MSVLGRDGEHELIEALAAGEVGVLPQQEAHCHPRFQAHRLKWNGRLNAIRAVRNLGIAMRRGGFPSRFGLKVHIGKGKDGCCRVAWWLSPTPSDTDCEPQSAIKTHCIVETTKLLCAPSFSLVINVKIKIEELSTCRIRGLLKLLRNAGRAASKHVEVLGICLQVYPLDVKAIAVASARKPSLLENRRDIDPVISSAVERDRHSGFGRFLRALLAIAATRQRQRQCQQRDAHSMTASNLSHCIVSISASSSIHGEDTERR